jgi:hypothetical protein
VYVRPEHSARRAHFLRRTGIGAAGQLRPQFVHHLPMSRAVVAPVATSASTIRCHFGVGQLAGRKDCSTSRFRRLPLAASSGQAALLEGGDGFAALFDHLFQGGQYAGIIQLDALVQLICLMAAVAMRITPAVLLSWRAHGVLHGIRQCGLEFGHGQASLGR